MNCGGRVLRFLFAGVRAAAPARCGVSTAGNLMVWAWSIALGTWLVGCQNTPGPGSASGGGAAARSLSWVSLERTSGSLREAPAYVVTLYSDGGVLFEGRANVHSKGNFTKHIPAERAAAVFTRLDVIDFWQREPRYDVEHRKRGAEDLIGNIASPDLPWDVITARHGGRFKRIDGLFFAPHELVELKTLIEETVDLAAWVGRPTPVIRL